MLISLSDSVEILWKWRKCWSPADDKVNGNEIILAAFDRLENIVGKGKIAGSHNVSKSFFSWVYKNRDCVIKNSNKQTRKFYTKPNWKRL